MQRLHNITSSLPVSQLRVDLLFWNDTYIYARYSDFRILDESTNYTILKTAIAKSTASAGCLATSNTPFMTRDRGWSYCGSWSRVCAEKYVPHWHTCCHCAGPFGKFYNYPDALKIPVRATGISWSDNAPKNATYDVHYYSFKQLEMLLML